MLKRGFDIVMSVVGLLCLSPLFALIAVWIVLDSRGGVFYKQQRVGLNNRDFALYKFRSMRPQADKGSLITIGGRDPRITRSGYYIRKFKLDELPQLINVLKGDMSIVGPRPEVRRYVDMYTAEQMQVLVVRPGITDLASIKYRNENELLETVSDPEEYYVKTIMPDKLAINLQYVQQQSFVSDLGIILRTLFAVVSE